MELGWLEVTRHTSAWGLLQNYRTGYVLDFVVLLNFCLGGQLGPKEQDPQHQEWEASHICQKNTSRKPHQTEAKATKILFGWSLQKLGLKYTTMLYDIDSRAFTSLQKEKAYG